MTWSSKKTDVRCRKKSHQTKGSLNQSEHSCTPSQTSNRSSLSIGTKSTAMMRTNYTRSSAYFGAFCKELQSPSGTIALQSTATTRTTTRGLDPVSGTAWSPLPSIPTLVTKWSIGSDCKTNQPTCHLWNSSTGAPKFWGMWKTSGYAIAWKSPTMRNFASRFSLQSLGATGQNMPKSMK